MLGTKLRSWMEAHIVRSKKKQQRAKDGKQQGHHHNQQQPETSRQSGSASGHASGTSEFPVLGPSPTNHRQSAPRGSKSDDWGFRNAGGAAAGGSGFVRDKEDDVEPEMTPPVISIDHHQLNSPRHQLQHQQQQQSAAAQQHHLLRHHHHHHHPHHHHHHHHNHRHNSNNNNNNNGRNQPDNQDPNNPNNNNSLSSPESAYSTGYSTDGTSPGASVPPEYYINLRTGKHYVHHQQQQQQQQQQQRQQQPQQQPQQQQQPMPSILVSPRHDQTIKRRPKQQPDNNGGGLQQSSTEEDIAKENPYKNKIPTPKPQVKLNKPESSGNSFHRRTESCDERVAGSSLGAGLGAGSGGGGGACWSPYMAASPYLSSPRQRNRIRTNPWLVANPPAQSPLPHHPSRGLNPSLGQGGGETSSTVGSSSTLSSCGVGGAKERTQRQETSYPSVLFSPTRLPNNNPRDIKSTNIYNTPFSPTPSSGSRKLLATVTTCSPRANRPCRHLRPGTSLSSSSTGPSSSGSEEDNHHGNTSDFSDDDVTLNEMLGKYDESYVYEKETDILSDSDPTDCEDQNGDYNDNSSRITEEGHTGSDLDFIDTGSLVELANSDSECSGKLLNRGHCTYDSMGTGIHSPPMGSETQLRRNSSRCSSRSRRCSNRTRNRSQQLQESGSLSGGIGQEGGGGNSSLRGSSTVLASRKRRRFARNNSSSGSMNRGLSQELQEEANAKPHRQYSSEAVIKGGDSPLLEHRRQLNLNKLLIDRLINNGGTRSAGTTPVSLRRNNCRDYNGKYLKNPHVSKLIDSNTNLSRRTSLEDSNKKLMVPQSELKKRSNSLVGYSAVNLHRANTPPTPPRRTSLLASENKTDTDGDMKYRRLIQEAETIFEDYKVKSDIWCNANVRPPSVAMVSSSGNRPTPDVSNSCNDISRELDAVKLNDRENELVNSQLDLLQEKINNNTPLKTSDNEDGILKTISKTLEKIIIRSSSSSDAKKTAKKYYKDTSEESDSPSGTVSKPHCRRSSEGLSAKKGRSQSPASKAKQSRCKTFCGNNKNNNNDDGLDDDERYEKRNESPVVSPKITNNNRTNNNVNNNADRRGAGGRLVWQEEGHDLNEKLRGSRNPAATAATLVSFRSFDLGNQIAVSSRYCPQSEPVKRKLYAGSSTFGKLQKSLMRKIPDRRYQVSDMTTADLRDENEILKVKVEQLIRQRLKVEARLRETQQQIDRLKFTDGINR